MNATGGEPDPSWCLFEIATVNATRSPQVPPHPSRTPGRAWSGEGRGSSPCVARFLGMGSGAKRSAVYFFLKNACRRLIFLGLGASKKKPAPAKDFLKFGPQGVRRGTVGRSSRPPPPEESPGGLEGPSGGGVLVLFRRKRRIFWAQIDPRNVSPGPPSPCLGVRDCAPMICIKICLRKEKI